MNNIVLVGFMGSGKSTIGHELAGHLGRRFLDLDGEIEAEAGRPISEIFAAEGEPGFRERERRRLASALERDGAVIAAGGGAPLADDNWRQMRAGNTVVALTAEPAELERRLAGSNHRPLLQPTAGAAIAALMPSRSARYLEADLVVQTDGYPPAELAARIASLLPSTPLRRIKVQIPGAEHEVVIGRNLHGVIASAARRLAQGSSCLLVTDPRIFEANGERLMAALGDASVGTRVHLVPPGEAAKDPAVLAQIYDALGQAGIDRGGLLIALGGGTVGDVAGFAAATWMRGIRFLQVPTTLLAMVDSSIGGKTAINLPAGKNMAGAVHQPSAIFCDLEYLASLPERDYRASLAEVIKAALIADRAFVRWLWKNMPAVVGRDPAALQNAVARALRIKAGVVSRDPFERGERAILNYGHTIGHALERAMGFGRIRHGEAVAWGMEVAARISQLTGNCSESPVHIQHELLEAAGLLTDRPAVERSALTDALRHDKKSRSGEPRWVLLRDFGRANYACVVEQSIVASAIAEVLPS